MIDKLHEDAFNGNQNTLVAYAKAKNILNYYTKLVKEMEELAQDEAQLYEPRFELEGFEFEKRNGRTMYDFKHIQQWQQLDNARKNLENDLKNALKLKGKIQMADEDGAEIELPKVTYTKDSLLIKSK